MQRTAFLVAVLLAGCMACLAWAEAPSTFRAAVVEYLPYAVQKPVTAAEAWQIMSTNLDQYEVYANEASARGARLIVFPEDGLYGAAFPSREQIRPYLQLLPPLNTVPCNSTGSPVAARLSCIALSARLYLVADVGSMVPCSGQPNCPSDGQFQYNTAVAFGPDGTLLAIYHKTHLFYEPQFDAGDGKPVYFDTDFGARIGLFICFDILFKHPATDLIQAGITHIAYPTDWVNYPPLITAVTTQAGWAAVQNVVLLAANVGSGFMGGGSGIYSGNQVLKSYFNLTYDDNKLLLANVPVRKPDPRALPASQTETHSVPSSSGSEPRSRHISLNLLDDAPNATIVPFVTGGNGFVTASHNNLTCTLHYLTDAPDGPNVYALAAFNGLYGGLMEAKICAVFACAYNNSAMCGVPTFKGDSLFRDFTLCGDRMDDAFLVLPLVAYSAGAVAQPNDYLLNEGCMDAAHLVGGRLLNAALFGRVENDA